LFRRGDPVAPELAGQLGDRPGEAGAVDAAAIRPTAGSGKKRIPRRLARPAGALRERPKNAPRRAAIMATGAARKRVAQRRWFHTLVQVGAAVDQDQPGSLPPRLQDLAFYGM
jgi:hypothetical protein